MTDLEANGPIHYRFSDTYDAEGVEIICTEYVVLSETPKGYWVIQENQRNFWEDWVKKHRRWVSKDSHKRFCYPDKERAFVSYCIRKNRQVQKLQFQLEVAMAAQKTASIMQGDAKAISEIGGYNHGAFCERPDCFNSYVWDL